MNLQVKKHWTSNDVLEMTLEKLQMIAMCNVTAQQKIKFLNWWNSSTPSRKARKFSMKPISEEKLDPFLNKCVWWVRVSLNL